MAGSIQPLPAKRIRNVDSDDCTTMLHNRLHLVPYALCNGLSRWAASSESHKYDNVVTPYRHLLQRFTVSETHEVEFKNPFAMMWYVCSTSQPAANFMVHNLAGRQCKLAFCCEC
jgi:hypothetical protein